MKFTYTTVPGELKFDSIVEIDIEYEPTDGDWVVVLSRTPIQFLSMVQDGVKLYININIAARVHFSQVMQKT